MLLFVRRLRRCTRLVRHARASVALAFERTLASPITLHERPVNSGRGYEVRFSGIADVTSKSKSTTDDRARRRIEHWDHVAEAYARGFEAGARRFYAEVEANLLVQWLKTQPNERVLELCCGAGRNTLPVLRAGFRVVALDLSQRMLELNRRAAGDASNLAHVRGNATILPFKDESFDAVFGTRFYYMLDRPQKLMLAREVARVLRRGGIFILQFNGLVWGLYREAVRVLSEGGAISSQGKVPGATTTPRSITSARGG